MKLFKLTDKEGYTRRGQKGETKWEEGFTLRLNPCENPRLCTSDVIHFYTNPNVAFLLNPIHSNIENPQLWEMEGEPVVQRWDKGGSFSLTAVKKLPEPAWVRQNAHLVQITFAELCSTAADEAADAAAYEADIAARVAARDADARDAADAAYGAARDATYEAGDARVAWAAARDAADVAWAAARDAAYEADAARDAWAAARDAHAAWAAARDADAAYGAAHAADAAKRADYHIDFAELADTAVKMVMGEEG